MVITAVNYYPINPQIYTRVVGVVYVSITRLEQDPPPISGQIWPRAK